MKFPCRHRLLLAIVLLVPGPLNAQEPQRWFQVEVSVFSNERQADRDEEVWSPERTRPEYPANLQRLRSLFEILLMPSLLPGADPETSVRESDPDQPLADTASEPSAQDIRREIIAATGPFPAAVGAGYRFPDFARDAFLQLPPAQSEFQQTNRALERSAEHRLLFHGLWRQPVPDPGAELPVAISGGERYGDHFELEGSLSFRFNANRDRVVIDSNLWLTEFVARSATANRRAASTAAGGGQTVVAAPQWLLPALRPELTPELLRGPPAGATATYEPRVVYHLQQSREMRSNEFHYVDHPALGLVVTVFPYEVPPLPVRGELDNAGDELEAAPLQ